MRGGGRIGVVIPALDEEKAVGKVVAAVPAWVDEIVVVDNGSRDATAQVAAQAGARVVLEPQKGYGRACLTGIAALSRPQVVVFLDADYSDHPEEMAGLVDPIMAGRAQLVIGSRVLGRAQPGALLPQARWGNWLACALIRLFWGVRFTDLGPFRAISAQALAGLGMADENYGWTVEMQVKAAQRGIPCLEQPVSYRRRIGKSHVSGTVKGSFLAGVKILYTIFRALVSQR